MTKEQFDLWQSRTDTVKIYGDKYINFCGRDRNVVASVIWSHRGFPKNPSEDFRRFNVVILEKGNSGVYDEMVNSSYSLDEHGYLMVNCQDPNYAIVYAVKLDVSQRNFSMVVKESPLLGTSIISKEESAGININF
jgi:hypothetical protein